MTLDIKRPPKGSKGFVPIMPRVRVEHAFARLGRWRRLARCYEGTIESAQAWLEVACLAYLFTRLRAEPP
jgi:putative transposase